MSVDREMLRPADVAALMGVTTGRVYQMIEAGVIPAIRNGRSITIPRRAWEIWLTQQRDRALLSVRAQDRITE